MMVFAEPQGLHSTAMTRVTAALKRHAPKHVKFVEHSSEADLVVLHVIGYPETEAAVNQLVKRNKKYVIIQYCVRSTQKPSTKDWLTLWQMAEAVWSYYDLEALLNDDFGVELPDWKFNFYHAPLGIDEAFVNAGLGDLPRVYGAITSGYVSGPSAEAISEVAKAAADLKMYTIHLGPSRVEGMSEVPLRWKAIHNISDELLADYYQRTQWVSGLRHAEGFELPALEGLCCGARPIVFDRPEMRRWYNGHATFVPESHGAELISHLTRVFSEQPTPVSEEERQHVLRKFWWPDIVSGLWSQL